jgi:acyl-CoA synthetase (AMP-forming)/AMP-acid ligase II
MEFCRSHLSHYKCPRSIEFLASLPKTGSGKVLKRELRIAILQHGRFSLRVDQVIGAEQDSQ